MFLGSLGIFFISFIEGMMFKNINESKNRNFITFLFCIAGFLGLFIVSLLPLLFKENLNWSTEFAFFTEKWFYLLAIIEILGLWLYREAYSVYKKNYTIVNMFMFSTVFLMPLYSYFLSSYVDLNQSIMVINNWSDALINSGLLFLGTLIYFYNKFKLKQITNLKILLALSLCMLNCFYFSAKLVQTYNGVLLYSFILSLISLNFLVSAFKAKESLKLDKKSSKTIKGLLIIKVFAQLIYIKSIAFIPVEIAPIVRRIGQLFSGLVIDKKIPSKTESFGIFVIIFVFVYNFMK